MIEKTSTMQSDATIEEGSHCAETPTPDKMTFSSPLLSDSKPLEHPEINLDDDIEKVEDSTSTSSNSSSDFVQLPDFAMIPEENPSESVQKWLKKISQKKPQPQPRVVKYQDLPYMGEITLDNSKPRRGRKPKKADICHLIYKNYGTIFPGTPNASSYLQTKKPDKGEQQERSSVQNKIISSLLEKRLTQVKILGKQDQNEPLNLCIRDLNHLKIRLNEDIKSEPQSDDDVELVTETPSPLMKGEPKFPATPDTTSTSSPSDTTPNTPEGASGNYVYWPNNNLFIHPMALQQQLMMYQRLAGNMNYPLPSHSPRPPPPPPPPPTTTDCEPSNDSYRKIVPKITKTKAEDGDRHKRNAGNCSEKTPAKRKRSAIFIPPIPTENTTNPATEVSICKFKFTGGAKPSLQEKKMLSVDSGGNFRYYSGTGDKSMRGYEFFPRETLQQQITNAQGSSTGAFLQASGEKIYPVPPLEITGGTSTSDFLLSPDLPSPSLPAQPEVKLGNSATIRSKKRKSRKSIQREKLEQTFKEKGFLIQTQQLESAEGATYCKFRQLRKFTRYLFRSWKDYLPGNVRELSESEQRELQEREMTSQAAIEETSVKSADLPPS